MNITRSLASVLAALFCCAPTSEAMNPDFQPPTIFFVGEPFNTPGPPPGEWQAVLGTWSVAGGTYNNNSGVAGTALTRIFEYPSLCVCEPATSVFFDNYRVHARMLNQRTGASSLVGLVYQYQDPANYYEAIFSPTGTASVRRMVNGGVVPLASASYQGGAPGIWFDVDVAWDAGTSTVKVNGIEVLKTTTQLETFGQVGLSTYGAQARFDNFSVEIPIGTQPFHEDFNNGQSQNVMAELGQWSAVNGTFNSTTVQQTTMALTPVSPNLFDTNFISLRARMLNPYGARGNQVGIVFNYQRVGPFNPGGYTELVFAPTGVARINQVGGGTVRNIATAAWAARRNAWFDVTFVMNFTSVSVWVDGQQVFEDVETRPGETPSGAVGLITHWAPGRFDDVWFDYSSFSPFTEGFDAGLPRGWSPASGTWSASAGTLNTTSVDTTDILVIPNGAETDYTYRARLLNRYGNSGNLVGLVYDYQSPPALGAGDRYEVVFAPTGQAYLDKFIQGVRYRVATATHTIPRNTWFTVELIRNGINTTVKANGVTLFNPVPQAQLPGGQLGVVTHWSLARFDDFSFTQNLR
jgi:hypothetical protein